MINEKQRESDRKVAMSKGYTFAVAAQTARGESWVETSTGLEDLVDAFSAVKAVSAWRTCIFLYREGLGYEYWCLKNPDSLNSSLLRMEITQ